MSRLIDADALDCELGTSERDIYVRECLAEAPSVVVEPHWISVTERLPRIGEYVLCTVKQPYRGSFHVCKYVDKDKWHDHPYFDWWHNGFPDVVAWMPIPKRYEESEA